MKFIHTADFHLSRSFGDRLGDFVNSLSQIVNFAKVENCDVVFVCGDVFHKRTPDNESRELFYNFVKTLHPIKVIVIGGTHDFSSGTHPLKPLADLKLDNFIFYERFKIDLLLINGKKIGLLVIPHLKNSVITKGEIEEKIYELVKLPCDYRFVLGHFSIIGACDGSYIVESPEDFTFPSEIFEKEGIDFVLLGHIHQPQRVSGRIYYSGAIEHIDWGEINQERGFFFINDREISFIPLKVRKKYDVVFNNGLQLKENIEDGSLVRLIIETPQSFDRAVVEKSLKERGVRIHQVVFKPQDLFIIDNNLTENIIQRKTWKDLVIESIENSRGYDKQLLKDLFREIILSEV